MRNSSITAPPRPAAAKPNPDPAAEVDFPYRVARWIVDHSGLLLALVVLGTIALAWPLRTLQVSSHESAEIPPDNPELVRLLDLTRRFDCAELLVVTLEAGDVFTPPALAALTRLTAELAQVREVNAVLSLSNAADPQVSGGAMDAAPFLEHLPATPTELAKVKRRALENPLWVGNLVSKDGTVAAINLMLRPIVEERLARNQTVREIQALLDRHRQDGLRLRLTGLSSLVSDSMRYVRRDTLVFVLLAPLVIALILLSLFRTVIAVLLPLIVIPVVMIWSLGPFVLAGGELNPVLSILPTLVAVGCLSNLSHLLGEYLRNLGEAPRRREALILTLRNMMGPCFMASATTVVGYVSLSSATLQSVRALGFWAAVGILTACILVLVLVPSLLKILPLPRRRPDQVREHTRLGRALNGLAGRLGGRGYARVMTAAALLAVLAAAGLARLRVEADLSKDLPESAPSVQGLRVVERKLAGIQTLELCLEGPRGVFKERWALGALDGLHTALASLDGVDKATSLAELIRLLHARLEPEAAAHDPLPADEGTLGEYLLALSTSEFAPFLKTLVTDERDAARLSLRVKTLSTTQYDRLVRQVEAVARERLDPRLTFRTTGVIKLLSVEMAALVHSQFSTLGLSFGATILLIMLYLRSIRLGALCLPQNGLAILLTLGLMGWHGIPLNFTTVMTSAVAFGMIVDNTIHLVVRHRRLRRSGLAPEEAAARALTQAGRSIVCTSAAVVAGFAVLGCSAFVPVRQFAFLIGFTISAAMLGDLIITPALLMRYNRR